MIKNQKINKYYFIFLISHLIIWTLIPSITNINLPLDTIEALAWGSNLDWGFSKHPPFSAFAVEFFYVIFGNQDWSYYLLSQIFVILAFTFVYKFSLEFFNNNTLALISILLLEGIYFYNYTTPEFNVNISQLPFWALSIFYSWRCLKKDKIVDYILLGIFIGLGFLSKYLFLYLIIGIKFLFIYAIIKKKIKSYKFLIVGPVALIIVSPHIFWLIENDFQTLIYGFQRTGVENEAINHFIFPIIFIFKQLGILTPTFLMMFFLIKKIKLKKVFIDQKMVFLIFTFFVPIILMFFTSIVLGAKIRTMWMTPFYLFFGVALIYIFYDVLNIKNLKKFFVTFLFFFILSPITYSTVSLTNDFKRTDYPGREISRLVQKRWNENFYNEIKVVVGDEWFAGNLSYHLKSRPKWIMEIKEKSKEIKGTDGVIYTGNPKILKNICPGIFGAIKPVGYCMIGLR